MHQPKLTVIGLDAATFSIVDPLLDAGQLPALRAIFDAGSRGVLRSTTPPITSQAWTTAFTGVNAGKHGLWEFVERDGNGYRLRLANGSFRRAPTVWDYLTAAGRGVGVVNVPFTWPAQPVNGFAVAGLDAADPERGMTYPESLVREARERFGKLELDHWAPIGRDGSIDLDQVRRTAEQRVELTLWLAERFAPELLIVVFMAADHALHYGWREWEERGLESALAEVYRILDGCTGVLVDALGQGGDVIVLSDHGGGGLNGEVNLNAWLAEEGYLEYAHGAALLQGEELARRGIFKLMERRERIPQGLRDFVKRRAPGLRDRVRRLKEFTVVDWERTRAFAYGSMGSVVINVRGRDRDGIVEPGAEYEALCDEIAAKALELREPETGELLVAAVHRRDSLFHGPELGKLPDLIVEFADYRWMGKGDLREQTPTFRQAVGRHGAPFVGAHRLEGVIGLAGPSARARGEIHAGIEDVAPTILYLLGEPIPLDFEGRVIEEALEPSLLEERPPEYREPEGMPVQVAQAYGPAEAEEVAERLRDLGYLE